MAKRRLLPMDWGAALDAIQKRHEAGEPHKVLTPEEIEETRAMIAASQDLKMLPKRTFSTEEAADCLGVTSQTIRNWHKSGKLVPDEVLENGRRCYTEEQIIAFKKKQMSVQQILIPDLKPREIVTAVEQFLSNFDPGQTVDVVIQVDEAGRKVSFIVTSEDGLLSQAKTLKMED